jgi:hypothetical protein
MKIRDTLHGGAIISERGDHTSIDPYHPSAAWMPVEAESYDAGPVGTLYALAACGKHYGWYDKAQVFAGDCPCPSGCASIGFTS